MTIFPRLTAIAATLSVTACAAPTPEPEVTRAKTLEFSQADFECLREAIYYEAAALDLDGGRAVAHVILNRTRDPRFPGTICGVISEGQDRGRCQFSYRCDGRAESFGDTAKFAGATRAAEAVVEAPFDDVTDGALYFHAKWMRPGWFATLDRTVTLGGNIFYREA